MKAIIDTGFNLLLVGGDLRHPLIGFVNSPVLSDELVGVSLYLEFHGLTPIIELLQSVRLFVDFIFDFRMDCVDQFSNFIDIRLESIGPFTAMGGLLINF